MSKELALKGGTVILERNALYGTVTASRRLGPLPTFTRATSRRSARVDDGGVIAATVAHSAVATIPRKGDPVGAFPDGNLR